MKKLYLFFLFALIMTLMPSSAVGQDGSSNGGSNGAANGTSDGSPNVSPLSNKDIVIMVDRKLDSETIIKTIKSSPCTFDTFPPLLREMKRRGVPDEVLQAMVEAPYGPSLQSNSRDDLGDEPIYHYADQLKQLGYINPIGTGRRSQSSRRTRTARTRVRQ